MSDDREQDYSVIDVPSGSILSSRENGAPIWILPSGEIVDFDLEGLIRDHKPKVLPR